MRFTSLKPILLMMLFTLGCGDLKPVSAPPAQLLEYSKTPDWLLSDLHQYSVDEFTLIVFKQGITRDQWSDIFKQTARLGQLRKQQKQLTEKIRNETDLDAQVALEEERDGVTLQITDILTSISEQHAAYMLNWGTQEKCQFTFDHSLHFLCKKLPKDAPQFLGAWNKAKPNQREDLWVFPWLETEISSLKQDWSMKLKLKPETAPQAQEWVWSGEIEAQGTFTHAHHPFGYVEMRLSRK